MSPLRKPEVLFVSLFGDEAWVCSQSSSELSAPKPVSTGARVGLAVEVRERLRVAWLDPADPSRGFSHLYLEDEDYTHLQHLAAQEGRGAWALDWIELDRIEIGLDNVGLNWTIPRSIVFAPPCSG
jgi:hypothetical protein